MKQLVDYYSEEKNLRRILGAVQHPQWRVWKAKLSDGTFKQNHRPITDTKELKRFLLGDLPAYPTKVYYSVALFLNPHKARGFITSRPGYVYAEALYLWSELYFDFDSEDDLEVARKDCVAVLDHMKRYKSFELKKVQYSGCKGFNLVYEPTLKYCVNNPHTRLLHYQRKRLQVLQDLPELRTLNDNHTQISLDQFRVYAATHTIKTVTGQEVIPIAEKDIRKQWSPERPTIRPMKGEDPITTTSVPEGPGLTAGTYNYEFVTNRAGKEVLVPVLEFRPKKKLSIPRLRRTQHNYNLSDLYLFDLGDKAIAMCLKTVDARRLCKIMKAAGATNYNAFRKHGHINIQLGPTKNEEGEVVGTHKFVGVMKRSARGAYSRSHSSLLRKYLGKEKFINQCDQKMVGGTAYLTIE